MPVLLDPSRVRLGCRLLALLALSTAPAACGSATTPVALFERELRLEIAESRVPCTGIGPRECLQVRYRADAPWQHFHDDIEGFTYEPGWRYVLRVAQRRVADPPVDGSSVAYRLVKVVTKTAVP